MIKIPKVNGVGAGAGQVFKQETSSNTNEIKTLVAGTGITVTNNASDITLASTAFPQFWTHEVNAVDLFMGGDFGDWYAYHVQHGSGTATDPYFDMRYCRFKNTEANWCTVFHYPHDFIKYSDPKFKVRIYWYSATGTGNTQRWFVRAKLLKKTQYMDDTDCEFSAKVIWTETIYSQRISGVNGADASPYLKSVAFTPNIKAGDTFGPGYVLIVNVGLEDAAAQDILLSKVLIQYQTDRTLVNSTEWPV